MEEFQQVLQALIDADSKKLVFAAFPSLRGEGVDKEEMSKSIDGLRKNEYYVAFMKTDVGKNNPEVLKTMFLSSLKKAQEELYQKFEKVIDLALKQD